MLSLVRYLHRRLIQHIHQRIISETFKQEVAYTLCGSFSTGEEESRLPATVWCVFDVIRSLFDEHFESLEVANHGGPVYGCTA